MAIVPDHAFTHAGVFHADDVFSSALLTMLNPSITIQRGFVVPDCFEGIVFDIGGGEFDHHGERRRVRENGVPYAAFGLLWERYGSMILCEADVADFDKSFVQPIDDADNGRSSCEISRLISDFNPALPAEPGEYDLAFESALMWARSVLKRRIASIRCERESESYVKECMSKCDGRVLVLDRLVPWKKAVIGSGYTYVVYPSSRQGFNVQAVPTESGEHTMVQPLPPVWRGKNREYLCRMTGISDFVFCHPSGFLCGTECKDSALQAAQKALLQN